MKSLTIASADFKSYLLPTATSMSLPHSEEGENEDFFFCYIHQSIIEHAKHSLREEKRMCDRKQNIKKPVFLLFFIDHEMAMNNIKEEQKTLQHEKFIDIQT
jgi:hypothetical protein